MEYYSETTEKTYELEELLFLENELQAKRYIKHHIKLIDTLPGKNPEEDKIIYVFKKEDTRELYKLWKAYKLL